MPNSAFSYSLRLAFSHSLRLRRLNSALQFDTVTGLRKHAGIITGNIRLTQFSSPGFSPDKQVPQRRKDIVLGLSGGLAGIIVDSEINGRIIHFKDNELTNLTDLWKSEGRKEAKRFKWWLRNTNAKEIITQVATELNDSNQLKKGAKKLRLKASDLLVKKRGRNGGTYAHWKIALAYAEFLSAKINSQFMDIIKARFLMKENPEAGVRFQFEQAVEDFMKLHKVDYDTAVYRITKSIPAFKNSVYDDFWFRRNLRR